MQFWVMWINQEPISLISDRDSFVIHGASLLPLLPLLHWLPQEEDSFYHTHHGDLCLTPPLEPGKKEVLGSCILGPCKAIAHSLVNCLRGLLSLPVKETPFLDPES